MTDYTLCLILNFQRHLRPYFIIIFYLLACEEEYGEILCTL